MRNCGVTFTDRDAGVTVMCEKPEGHLSPEHRGFDISRRWGARWFDEPKPIRFDEPEPIRLP